MNRSYSIESIREIAAGDEEFMVIVAKTFLEEIPPDLLALNEAMANKNKELVYQFVHKMKPNLEMFGIKVNKEITAIESWTKSSKSSKTIAQNMERLTNTVETVFEELKEDF